MTPLGKHIETKCPNRPKCPNATDAADRELLKRARAGDTEAANQIIEDALPVIRRITHTFRGKYPWIDRDDLAQAMAITVYRHINRFDLGQTKNAWRKYSYHRLYGEAQQYMREMDPLGIKWPHRSPYPRWAHTGQADTRRGDYHLNEILATTEDDMPPCEVAELDLPEPPAPSEEKPRQPPTPHRLEDLVTMVGQQRMACLRAAGAIVGSRCRRCDGVVRRGSCACDHPDLQAWLTEHFGGRTAAALWLADWLAIDKRRRGVNEVKKDGPKHNRLGEWSTVAESTGRWSP